MGASRWGHRDGGLLAVGPLTLQVRSRHRGNASRSRDGSPQKVRNSTLGVVFHTVDLLLDLQAAPDKANSDQLFRRAEDSGPHTGLSTCSSKGPVQTLTAVLFETEEERRHKKA